MVLRNLRRFKNYVNQYQFLMLTLPCRIIKLYRIWNFYKFHIDIFLFSFPFFKYRSIVNFNIVSRISICTVNCFFLKHPSSLFFSHLFEIEAFFTARRTGNESSLRLTVR